MPVALLPLMLRSLARCAKPLAAASPLRTPVAARAPLLLNAGRRCMSTFEKEEDIDVDSVSYGSPTPGRLHRLELGIYDAIADAGEKGLTLADIQKSSGVSAPRLQTLLTSLTSIKSLKRTADGIYTNSPNSSKYLVTSSRAYYGDYLRYQMGRQFYHRMGALPEVMSTGEAPSYASWFSDPETAKVYTQAQHNGSVATARYLVKKKLELGGVESMLDVGGGSGAFSYVFTGATPGLKSTVLELPEVCKTGEGDQGHHGPGCAEPRQLVGAGRNQPRLAGLRQRPSRSSLSYISGSVPEPVVGALYANAYKQRETAQPPHTHPSHSHEV